MITAISFSKYKKLIIRFIFLINLFLFTGYAYPVMASQDGVGINFTPLETPKSRSSVWRWRSDVVATKHIGETITIQYGVFWCKTSSGQVGQGTKIGPPCAPDLTPTDMVETIIFQERQFVVQNTTFQSTHRSVDCGRIQIDIGGLGGILGGDTYDTGVSCGGSPNPQPTLGATNPPPLSSFFPPAPTSVLDNVRSDQRAIIEIIKAIYLELAGEGGDEQNPVPQPTTPPDQPSPEPTNQPQNPNKTFKSLRQLFDEIGGKVGLPPKIIESVLMIESAGSFNLSPEEIDNYSRPGNEMANCPISVCSARGPMQMTTGIDGNGDKTCPKCGAGYCPNAWDSHGYGNAVKTYGGATHEPKWCNIRDNIYAAAAKLKADSRAQSSTQWTRDDVNKAATAYFGTCKRLFVRDGIQDTYCGHLWRYYTTIQ